MYCTIHTDNLYKINSRRMASLHISVNYGGRLVLVYKRERYRSSVKKFSLARNGLAVMDGYLLWKKDDYTIIMIRSISNNVCSKDLDPYLL